MSYEYASAPNLPHSKAEGPIHGQPRDPGALMPGGIPVSAADMIEFEIVSTVVQLEESLDTSTSGEAAVEITPTRAELGGKEREVVATVLLPAYNEADALPQVLASLFAVLDDSYEVIVVDDGSTDDTVEIARSFPCRLISHHKNQGKGAAVRTGLSEARGEHVIVMDADNTYPPEAIPQMVSLLQEYEFVRGIRQLGTENTPVLNRIGNKIFDSALKMVYGLEGSDHLSGLYGLRRDAFNSMHFVADGFDLEVEIGIKARAHQLLSGTMPIDYRERLGEKKLRPLQDGWHILHRMLSLALLYNPSRIFILPGVILWTVSAIFALVLGTQPSISSLIGLNTGSFVVAALGVPTGFQLVVFGLAAALYGVERHIPPKGWLLTLSRARVRFWAGIFGAVLFGAGVVMLLYAASGWATGGAGYQFDGQILVLSMVLVLWGLQTILAVLFVSIFAGRIEQVATARARAQGKKFKLLSVLRRTQEAE